MKTRVIVALAVQVLNVSADTFYVSNYENNSISKVTAEGVVAHFATVDAKPYGMACASNGNLFVVIGQMNQRVVRVTPEGVVSTAITLPTRFDGTVLAIDPTGAWFIASQGGSSIRRWTGTLTLFASGFALPFGMAFDQDLNLFVSDMNNSSIRKVARDGTSTSFAMNVPFAHGLAFDAEGNLYAGSQVNVLKFTPAGARSTFATGLAGASGMAFDTKGDLYVVEFQRQTLVRITPDGVVHPFATGFRTPQFVVVQPDFSAPSLAISQSKQITISGGINQFYEVSASDDLATWTPIRTNQIHASTTKEIADPGGTTSPARFYQARMRP